MANINYIHFEVVDSTSAWAKRHAHELNPVGITCITADEQTGGRGRFGRKWLSPKGQNILATLFFQIPKESPYLGNIGQILAYSCASILQEIGLQVQLKWPNDILVLGKKIAGVLCETVEMGKNIGVALGIGLNVNMDETILKTINQPATSIAAMTGKTWEVKAILERLVGRFVQDFETLQKNGFAVFQPDFEKLLAFKEEEIRCSDGVQGICKGISKEGHLLVLLPSGRMREMVAGEVWNNV
jgi:BirA family biotin operon repressor/biotin-[acetyl-CoA-carboxylase] ligase